MQVVDPKVSQRKFDQEIGAFVNETVMHRSRGIYLIEHKFPNAYFAFGSPSLAPCPIVFAVKINFDNYDLEPLSIEFIHPFTFSKLKLHEMSTHFNRNLSNIPGMVQLQALLQQEPSPDAFPFLCIAGVREYHNHPAHTGNSWLLHRKNGGEGSLGFLIEKLYEYGIVPINGFQFPPIFSPQIPLGMNTNLVPH